MPRRVRVAGSGTLETVAVYDPDAEKIIGVMPVPLNDESPNSSMKSPSGSVKWGVGGGRWRAKGEFRSVPLEWNGKTKCVVICPGNQL